MSLLDNEFTLLNNTDIGNPKLDKIVEVFDKSHNCYSYEWNNQLYFEYNIPQIKEYTIKIYITHKYGLYYIKLKLKRLSDNYEFRCNMFLDNTSTKINSAKKKVKRIFKLLANNPIITSYLLIGRYDRHIGHIDKNLDKYLQSQKLCFNNSINFKKLQSFANYAKQFE